VINQEYLKGIIDCPLCQKEKFFIYSDMRGRMSMRCWQCSRLVLVDGDNLTAQTIRPLPRFGRILLPRRWAGVKLTSAHRRAVPFKRDARLA